MSIFSLHAFDDHEMVAYGRDAASGLRCIVAIHNTVRGPALGGTRMWNYETEHQAITDALRLSRGMTYKAAAANLPYGGGKAVIFGDPRTQKTEALLRAYGRFVESLGGRYLTAEDVGTTVADMDIVRHETRYARGLSDGHGNPSPATAYGVFKAIQAAVRYRFGRDDLSNLTVAVQGLGNVGIRLCAYLAEAGAHLIVTDLRKEAVREAVRELGASTVAPEEIFDQKADVFAPCALGAMINDDTIPRLRAEIVAGAANNQLAEPHHGEQLRRRGILYAPDYVANAGGLYDVAYEGSGISKDEVLKTVAGIGDTLMDIFARADAASVATNVVADRIAEARFTPRDSSVLAA